MYVAWAKSFTDFASLRICTSSVLERRVSRFSRVLIGLFATAVAINFNYTTAGPIPKAKYNNNDNNNNTNNQPREERSLHAQLK